MIDEGTGCDSRMCSSSNDGWDVGFTDEQWEQHFKYMGNFWSVRPLKKTYWEAYQQWPREIELEA